MRQVKDSVFERIAGCWLEILQSEIWLSIFRENNFMSATEVLLKIIVKCYVCAMGTGRGRALKGGFFAWNS